MPRRDCPSCGAAWHSTLFYDTEGTFECPKCGVQLIAPPAEALERVLGREVVVLPYLNDPSERG